VIRLIVGIAAAVMVANVAEAAAPSGPIPLPRPRPAVKAEPSARMESRAADPRGIGAPMSLAPPLSLSPTAAIPSSGVLDYGGAAPLTTRPAAPRPAAMSSSVPPARPRPPLAMAVTLTTSPLDLNTVKQAIELVRRNRQGEATNLESTIADPLARKLVEWVILRSDEADLDFARYAAFINANPSWPSIVTLRRRAEAAAWQQQPEPRSVIAFFNGDGPRTGKGRLALARALLAVGDRAGAQAAVREAWRNDAFSADVEAQAREMFAGLITPADDKTRMDDRLYAEDDDAGKRAASHLGSLELAIANARAAVINKSSSARTLLEAVPPAARHDPGYMFSRIQWLRRGDKISEATQWILAAPHDPERVGDPDQWWVERRLIARKLLDLGNYKAAYEVAAAAAAPTNENYRAEQHFTAGWIALRFLRDPGRALSHFARIGEGVSNPITLARASYWQGRAAEALGRGAEARAHYEAAARYPTAYYGQLARARLGIDGVALRPPPEPAADHRRLEAVRVFEVLYAIDARDLVATMAADLADKVTDGSALATLAELTTRHNDARATLLIGKMALSRGFPLEHYAFPVFGIPNYHPIGPQVEPCVVYAITRQESAFNPRVVSSANAIGLMQVTPEAGRDIARQYNVAFDQRRLLDDPAYNAQIGSAELGRDINDFGGSYVLAFAAYNAGPRRAKEWMAQYGDPRSPKVDPIDWIERIPFSETRNYVQRVMENMQVYRARLGNDPRLLIEADLRRGR
jgi:soluble lytic murein transglycosylase